MLEKSSHISNSSAHEIRYFYVVFSLTHSMWGTKLSLLLITSQMLITLIVEQCAAQSHSSWAQVPV